MARRRRNLLLLAASAVFLVVLLWPEVAEEPPPSGNGLELAALMGAGEQGPRAGEADAGETYARALTPREFVFPDDHGPHPGYRNEWWYFTGNVEDAGGQRFGYQWVIFRLALSAEPVERDTDWATNHAFMAHFALTDADGRKFFHFERFARGAAGLAGAQVHPLKVWLEDWRLEEDPAGPWRLYAKEADVEIELELAPLKPVVLNGERGLSQKSAGAGNASYYYSISRLDTRGILRIAGRDHEVRGHSWLDREWGTSALAEDQQGWDWFALQLDDGTDIMFYQLRRRDGTIDPFSKGTLILPSGEYSRLGTDEVLLETLDTWTSPRGATYPSRWSITLPGQDLALEVRPVLADQELDLSVRYWEGAVDVSGRRGGERIAGRGYVELVGY